MAQNSQHPEFGQPSLAHSNGNGNQPASMDDFLKPISVKSKNWATRKVNIGHINNPIVKSTPPPSGNNVDDAPAFAKYVSQSPASIAPPTNEPIYATHTYQHDDFDFQTGRDVHNNSSNAISTPESKPDNDENSRRLIQDLLKPNKYEKVEIDPKERIIKGLNVQLLDHQVSGLKFLLHREKAIAKKRHYLKKYYQELENNEEAESFFNKGGILADDMGLGKTVQMIALILSNKPKKKTTRRTTLIVCPALLVVQWCNELEEKSPSLTVLSFHGAKRPTDPEIVHKYDVVVTSYQTLSSEFEKFKTPLYDPQYPLRRVVLDEAHTIKNRDTKAYQSCIAITAERRWCLTGTPIQNKIDELYSLFSFLGVNKYEDVQIWNAEIGIKIGKTSKAASKALGLLHTMLDKFMLRRTKAVLIENKVLTVSKNYHTEVLDFTPFESNLYKKLNDKIIKSIIGSDVTIDEYNSGKLNANGNVNLEYMSILTKLLRLRQLCCSWELLFNLQKSDNDADIDSLTYDVSQGMKALKTNSSNEGRQDDDTFADDDINDILSSLKSMKIDKSFVEREGTSKEPIPSIHTIKVQRVINILKKDDPQKPRKTIIFSEFTSMLDILTTALFDNKIKFVRYDGKMDKKSKDDALTKLKTDGTVHVLLCSLKCGAYGLNITSCSRVILYEPFWNPAIGAQAIDRAYRIGQQRDVDIHEFFIANTIEMRIKELQDKKKLLMKAVVDKDATAALGMIGNGLSKTELLGLLGIKPHDLQLT
jgi:transcription termination factor 2